MKSIFKIILASGLAFTLASCGALNDPYGNNYPNNYPNNGTVYRSPDGTVYRQGDVYRDRNGNVYQNGRVISSGGVYSNTRGRNQVGTVYPRNNRNLPPGQAKKVYGGNAKDYAPGQMKKKNGNWDSRKWDNGKKKGKSYKKHKNHR